MVVLRFCCFRARRACPQSQGVSNWNLGFLLVPACFSVVMSLGHDTCSLHDAFGLFGSDGLLFSIMLFVL